MTRRFVSFAFLALAAAATLADEVGIPDNNPGTGAACNAIPFSASFSSGEGTYQAQIAPGLIGRGGRITEISFPPCASGTFTATDCLITMAHNPIPTASCTFAANLVNDVKVVYSGPLSYAFTGNAWSPIGLQCDFDYNGVDQLVMEIRYRGAAAGASFYRTATDPRRTYALGVGTFGATTAMSCNGAAGTKMLLTFTEVKDGGGSTPVPGGVKNLVFNAPRDPGLTYYAGASLGSVPGVPIPPCRVLPLNVDVLLVLSLTVPAVFSSFSGILDPSGNATAAIYLPGAPLSGTIVYLSFVTLTQVGAVKSIAGSASFQIQ